MKFRRELPRNYSPLIGSLAQMPLFGFDIINAMCLHCSTVAVGLYCAIFPLALSVQVIVQLPILVNASICETLALQVFSVRCGQLSSLAAKACGAENKSAVAIICEI